MAAPTVAANRTVPTTTRLALLGASVGAGVPGCGVGGSLTTAGVGAGVLAAQPHALVCVTPALIEAQSMGLMKPDLAAKSRSEHVVVSPVDWKFRG